MYSVLLADDEQWIRKGVKCKLDSLGFEFENYYEGEDGLETLHVIESRDPDIVFLDIIMPNLSGIELLKEIRKRNIYSKIIIVTGLAEFEYAQIAANLGICGYLLKPINDDKLKEVTNTAIRQLDNATRSKEILENNDDIETRNKQMMLEKEINHLIHLNDKEHIISSNFEENQNYAMMLIHIDKSNVFDDNAKHTSIKECKKNIKNIIKETLEKENIVVIDNQHNIFEILILFQYDNQACSKKKIENYARNLHVSIQSIMNISSTIAVSNVCEKIDYVIYDQLRKALDNRLMNGINNVYIYDECTENTNNKNDYDYEITLLKQYIECKDMLSSKQIIHKIMVFNSKDTHCVQIDYYRNLFVKMVNAINETFKKMSSYELFDARDISGETLDYFDDGQDVSDYIFSKIKDNMSAKKTTNKNCKSVVSEVKSYIDKNYEKSLNIKDIANKVGYNSNYLSSVFKKETKHSFSEYLNKKRIDAACRLISTSQLSISLIAEAIGFNDPHYFYKVFKRVKGITPSQYKDGVINQQ